MQESESRPLRIAFGSDIRSFDPRIGIDYPTAYVSKMLFEGLMRMDHDGKVRPGVAERYEVSEDQKTYTFYLKETSWSNGDPVTAHDFAHAWRSVIYPKSGRNLGSSNFYPIKNAREVLAGKLPVEEAGIRVLDDYCLQVELVNPTPYFLEVTATSCYYPIHHKLDLENPDWADKPENILANGPFILDHYSPENEIVVKKNPDYWDAASVSLTGIQVDVLADSSTQLALYERGKLDWLGMPLAKINLDAVEHLRQKDEINTVETLGLLWFFMNVEAYPFNNKKMRQAFAYALNRKEITDNILYYHETPAMGILPPQIATQKEPYFQDADVKKAQALFEEALAELEITREDFPPVVFHFNPSLTAARTAQTVQQQWKKALGVDVTLEQQEWKFHYQKVSCGQYQIGLMQWHSWLRDPIYMMQTFCKDSGVNFSRWDNEEYDRLIGAAEAEVDPAKRLKFFNEAEALLMDEMPVVPMYFVNIGYCKNPRLKDAYVSDLYEVDFRWAKISE